MLNEVPDHLKKPSNQFFWECQELSIPDELLPFRPLWISSEMLRCSEVSKDGKLICGEQVFDGLYCNAQWMEEDCLESIVSLQEAGATVIFKSLPKQPGTTGNKKRYETLLEKVTLQSACSLSDIQPVFESPRALNYWVRNDSDTYNIFVAHPGTNKLRYPIAYKCYEQMEDVQCPAVFTSRKGNKYSFVLDFNKATSFLLSIDDNTGLTSIKSFGQEVVTEI